MAVIENEVANLKGELESLKKDNRAHGRFQAWMTGAWTSGALLAGIFLGDVKRKLGIG